MDSKRAVLQARPCPSIFNSTVRACLNGGRGERQDGNTAWPSIALGFIGTLVLILIQACAPKPFQVNLNPNLGPAAVTKIASTQPCPKTYRLALDGQSKAFVIKTRPENCCYPGLSLDWIFPIGKTLAGYLEQAQKGESGKIIPLQLDMSDFRFVMDASSPKRPYVDSLKYKAHFTGPDPIGFFTISETAYGSMPIKGGEQKMYDAVSEALRSTTIELFTEVANRMCRNS
ncbi:MAG: hypothetical protein R3351_08730 [Nitrospirales bacterium]|nr:hypothetical protein [Nitrospirales bacterium]